MLNVIAVMGRVVADPELRMTTNGINTTTFTIACDRNFVKQGEQRETDFFDIVAWRGAAEFASKYFKKGQLVAVNGSLQTRSYEDKNGNKRKVYEIVSDNLHFAEPARKPAQVAAPTDESRLDIDPPETLGAPAGTDDFMPIDESEDLPF